ncbi:hypothetical protein T492DRAFT_833791 [Pavlovales sp. CCMP2436]|nr:hypothetical protein T492DRAFT_833791 [Pavlovales sp. CCMP2436]
MADSDSNSARRLGVGARLGGRSTTPTTPTHANTVAIAAAIAAATAARRAQRPQLVRPVGFEARALRPLRDTRESEMRWRLKGAVAAMQETDYISAHHGASVVHAALSVDRAWAPLIIDQRGVASVVGVMAAATDAELLCIALEILSMLLEPGLAASVLSPSSPGLSAQSGLVMSGPGAGSFSAAAEAAYPRPNAQGVAQGLWLASGYPDKLLV